MRAILHSTVTRWVLTGIGTALLAWIIWWLGPLVPWLGSAWPRAAIVAVMVIAWLALNLIADFRRRRRDAALEKGVSEAAPDPTAIASAEEAAAIGEKLSTALGLLRKARGTRGYLYEQPWYAIIGPPGAGKTTALLNAGLHFPLAAEMGQSAVAGVGGTRLCDWWFTEEAVLIDTAGRYTTQDSDAAVDRAGWEAFLDLLKRTRLRQPLNGILVAIGLNDIATTPAAERLAHARAVRRRIREVEERLAVRLPVYLIFTKADLIAGFSEFFDHFDRDSRAQVWGATFPLSPGEVGPASTFAPEFEMLIEALNNQLIDRLQAERSPDRRGLISGFAAQMASLEVPLREFLYEAFAGSRLDPAPMLRGFYFTSGTQQGTPIDRLTATLARTFGIDQSRLPSLRAEQGRSYFLGRLIKDVVFNEAMLVSERPGTAWRRRLVRSGGLAAVLVVLLLGVALFWHARSVNEAAIAEMNAALADYQDTAQKFKLDPVADDDVSAIVALLNKARALPFGYEHGRADLGSWWELGLSQKRKLGENARAIYENGLEWVLLPRLIYRLETQMRQSLSEPDVLYQVTRVYLMLGSKGPMDRNLVRQWIDGDWELSYPGALNAPLRKDLQHHLDALLKLPLRDVSLDNALVETAQIAFSRVTPASRIYSLIKPSAAAKELPPWLPSEPLGNVGARVFVRASGAALNDPDHGVPGFFTVDGFYNVLLPMLPGAAKQIMNESWVLGARAELPQGGVQSQKLEHDVIGLYEDDYQKHWDAMLGDLNLVPLRTPQQASDALYILSSTAQSPIRDLLVAVARQLTLTKSPPQTQANAQANAATKAAAKTAAENMLAPVTPNSVQQLRPIIAAQQRAAIPPPEPPGQRIDNDNRALRNYVGTGGGAPIDQTLRVLDQLRLQLVKLANAPPNAPPPAALGDDPVQLLQSEAASDPQPVRRWVEALAADAGRIRVGGAQKQVHDAWNASGGPAVLCRQAITGRYPFNAGSSNDIPLDDFAKLLSPGGLIDGFFNTQLRPYVDTSGPGWHGQTVDGVTVQISPADLAAFQRAATIRDAFFGVGGTTPAVRFELTPLSLDDGATQVTLDLGGATVTYTHGPPRATQITWPGPNGMSNVRLVFDPAPKTGAAAIEASGPWALFHLLDQGRLQREDSAERYKVTFKLGDREAAFEIRAGSVVNPFGGAAERGFQCPNL